jgi:enoyl-CoA hydratase/carnithine racemase
MPDQYEEFGLRVEVDGPTTTVTLCRPDIRNAQSPRMWAALAEIGESLPEQTRVAVVRAEGPTFSAGLDRRMFTADGVPGDTSLGKLLELDDPALAEAIAAFQEAFSWWRRPGLVTVAAVQGHAVGAGFQLALACDLRVLADDAQLSMRETSMGLVPDLGGIQPLVDAVGYSRALEICVTGRSVDAREALELGLATVVVRRAELGAAVADLVAAVVAPPHGAVTATKALLCMARTRGFHDQLAAERSAQVKRLRELGAATAGNKAGRSGVG